MDILKSNISIFLPDDINNELLQGYGGCYCILNTDTWQMYSYTKRRIHEPVFCNISDENVKLYETDEGAINSASRIISNNPTINLCVTYYGLALSNYFKAGLILKEKIKKSDGNTVVLGKVGEGKVQVQLRNLINNNSEEHIHKSS
jgi:hypothetical protein